MTMQCTSQLFAVAATYACIWLIKRVEQDIVEEPESQNLTNENSDYVQANHIH